MCVQDHLVDLTWQGSSRCSLKSDWLIKKIILYRRSLYILLRYTLGSHLALFFTHKFSILLLQLKDDWSACELSRDEAWKQTSRGSSLWFSIETFNSLALLLAIQLIDKRVLGEDWVVGLWLALEASRVRQENLIGLSKAFVLPQESRVLDWHMHLTWVTWPMRLLTCHVVSLLSHRLGAWLEVLVEELLLFLLFSLLAIHHLIDSDLLQGIIYLSHVVCLLKLV